ncbi:unnamed protein product, partial [Arabidopsis halleri]
TIHKSLEFLKERVLRARLELKTEGCLISLILLVKGNL